MKFESLKFHLTNRELEVLELLAQGQTSKQIGCTLGISETTVITYKERLKEKLGVKNCLELIYKSSKIGII